MKPLVKLLCNPTLSDPFSDSRGLVPSYVGDSIGATEDAQGNIQIEGRGAFRYIYRNGKFYLALETGITNLLTDKSHDFARWTLDTSVLVYTQTQLGPTGEFDADEIVTPATAGKGLTFSGLGDKHGQTLTFSVWMRTSSGSSNIRLQFGSNNTYTSVKVLTTTWQRFVFTQTLVSGDTNSLAAAILTDDTTAPSIYLFGAQVEIGTINSTYVPTSPIVATNRNLVSDGDLGLDGVSSWTGINADETLTKDIATVLFGKQSLKVVVASASGGVSQTLTTVSGGFYRFYVWINIAIGTQVVLDVGGALSVLADTGGVWSLIEQTFKASSTSTTVKIRTNGGSVPTFYIGKAVCRQQLADNATLTSSLWTTSGAITATEETTTTHSGGHAIRCSCTDTAQLIKLTQTNLSLVASTWYRITAWIYLVSQSGAGILPQILIDSTISNGASQTQSAKATVGAWQRVTTFVKTTGSITAGHAISFGLNATGTAVFIVDDVLVVALDSTISTRTIESMSLPLTNKQASNLCVYSEQFDNAAWVKFGSSTVSADNTTAPDGSSTADKFTLPLNSSISQSIGGYKLSTSYCFSVWLKADHKTLVYIDMNDGIGTIASNYFFIGPQWRRVFVTGATSSSATGLTAYIERTSLGEQGAGSAIYWAWGAQVEEGSAPSRYVKTVATAQSPIFTSFASQNISKAQGSYSFWTITPWAGQGVGVINLFGDAGNDECIYASGTTLSLKIKGLDKAGAVTTKTISAIAGTDTMSTTTENLICVTWSTERDGNGKLQQSRVKVYINGNKAVDQTYTDIQEWTRTSATTFYLNDGNNHALAYLRDIKIWPAALTDSEVTDLYVAA